MYSIILPARSGRATRCDDACSFKAPCALNEGVRRAPLGSDSWGLSADGFFAVFELSTFLDKNNSSCRKMSRFVTTGKKIASPAKSDPEKQKVEKSGECV